MAESYDCWACGTEGSFHVRIDKKGRPYYACGACNHRVWVYTGLSFFMMGEIAKAITKQRGEWQAAAKEQMAAIFGGDVAPSMAWRQLTAKDLTAAGVKI